MKCLKKTPIYIALTTIALGALLSCKKDKEGSLDNILPSETSNSLVSVLSADPNFSTFVAALKKTNLDKTIAGRYPGTVFAPNNTAFSNANVDVNAMSVADLTPIVQYHLVANRKLATYFTNKDTVYRSTFSTTEGNRLFFTNTPNGTSINGLAKLTKADIQADNGVIQAIDHLLLPPAGNILKAIQSDSANFIYLATALAVVDTSKDLSTAEKFPYKITQKISSDSTTFFAPTNMAFIQALGLPSGSDMASVKAAKKQIAATNPAVLNNILTYHIVNGKRFGFSSALTSGETLPVLMGRSLKLNKTGNNTTVTDAKGNAANVVKSDIMAYNGVIHAIDKVLMP